MGGARLYTRGLGLTSERRPWDDLDLERGRDVGRVARRTGSVRRMRLVRDLRCSLLALAFMLASAGVRAQTPAAPRGSAPVPPAASSAAGAAARVPDDVCDGGVDAWATRATAKTGLRIVPRSCVAGALRLAVSPAGCDFEISRDRGFRRTPDGAFAVSPIVDLDWGTAPAPMKHALDSLLLALASDPTLTIRVGTPIRHPDASSAHGKLAAATSVVLVAAMTIAWLLAQRRRTRAVEAAPLPSLKCPDHVNGAPAVGRTKRRALRARTSATTTDEPPITRPARETGATLLAPANVAGIA